MRYFNNDYLKYIRSKPCVICGSHLTVQAHHHGRRGMGQKTDDYRTVPLCSKHHYEYHNKGFAGDLENWSDCDFKEIQLTLLIEWIDKVEK